MKYLNNIITGEVIRVIKISDSGIFYSIFENTFHESLNQFAVSKRIDNLINDVEILHGGLISELKYEAALQLIAEIEIDFVINEDSKNWFIVKGSDGTDTTIRLFIPDAAYDNALKAKDDIENFYNPLWQIISFGTQTIDSKYSQITYNSIVLYLLELLPEHKAVINMYVNDGVLLENKI